MRIRVTSASPEVEVNGLGIIETNVWVEMTEEQEERYIQLHGRTLLERAGESFEVESAPKPGTPVAPPKTVAASTPVGIAKETPVVGTPGGDQ